MKLVTAWHWRPWHIWHRVDGTFGLECMSRAETTPPNKQARLLGHRAKAGVVSVDSC